jgi:hypothetical protein
VRRSRLPHAGAVLLAAALTAGIAFLAPGGSALARKRERTSGSAHAVQHDRVQHDRVQHARVQRARRQQRAEAARAARAQALLRGVVAKRDETWRWERLMTGRRVSPYSGSAARARSIAYRLWALRVWTARAAAARRRAAHPPRLAAWLCIHRYEGAWNDPDPPYFGGLQMSLEFQRAYGPGLLARKGTADRWTPLEQMWAAERAYSSGLGFRPWPSTARSCGLL